MKIKLLHCQLLRQTWSGECLLTLESVRGLIWKNIQKFQMRGSYSSGDWYYYPSGIQCPNGLERVVDRLVRKAGKELERQERVRGWYKEVESERGS